MSKMEIKSFDFEVKANDEQNIFEGYASVFDNVDNQRDIIEKGAFSKTIQENKRIKVLWQHNHLIPIGKPIHMEEDSKGLYVKAKISLTEEGKKALILMKDGVIDTMSIGYNTIKDLWEKSNQVRRIKEVRLWEFSPVTFPANDMAGITSVKNHDFEHILFSLNELKAGKAISGKNQTVIKNAIQALQDLLDLGEVEPLGANTQLEGEEKAAQDVMKLLKEMQTYSKFKGVI